MLEMLKKAFGESAMRKTSSKRVIQTFRRRPWRC